MANEKKGLVDITTGVEVTDANANGILDLASGEVTQLANIGSTTIILDQWGYLGNSDQGIATGDTVTFTSLGITGEYVLPTADGTVNQVMKTNASGVVSWQDDTTTSAWGEITGTLSSQTDLQNALDAKWDKAPVTAPALPSSTGTQGTWATGGGYMYVCTATDTWVRWAVVTSWT